jgi:DNA topoisomerase-1
VKLVIVESPTKAKTLAKHLGKDFKVKASNGHVRDLPKKELGVDVEKDFEPKYTIPAKARKTITALKKEAMEAESVVLATDPDREGEAIAWHISEIFKKDKKMPKNLKFERVVFHEITPNAIDEAFGKSGEVSDDLVDAQQARRVLDRLVGYKLSPLLWKKVRYGLSAGRVQSVAVRLIVERERERQVFKPEEYWSLIGEFETEGKEKFNASLGKKDGKKLEVKDEKQAKGIEKDLKGDTFSISEVKQTERKRSASPPFRTSTLQQTASNFFGFTAKRTMSAAQKLFENGYITYHRTDSFNLASQFIKGARAFIKSQLGDKYVPAKPNVYKTKAKGAQEAHEAIRPTNVKTQISALESTGLKGDEIKLYSLILRRSLECQIKPAIYDQTSIKVLSGKGYEFNASGSVIKFDGWLAVGKLLGLPGGKEALEELPKIKENTAVTMNKLDLGQHFTQPPARYSDASLIKALEELGIGRPSTYAPTISTIQQRKYVVKEGRYFVPETVAFVVTDLLVEYFRDVIGYRFTADMEEKLDKIADGKLKWVPVIKEFYDPFEKKIEEADAKLDKREVTKLGESDEECPKCDKGLDIKLGKYGKFLSCSGFPECDFAKPLDGEGVDESGEAKTFGKCEECGEGDMTLKQGRFGKFLACSRYPECKTTKPYLDKIDMKCPKCEEEGRENGEVIVKKAKGRTFYGCSNYPDCDYASWKNPKGGEED